MLLFFMLSACGPTTVTTLLVGGDCMFGRKEAGARPISDPWEGTAAALHHSSLFLFNLETTIGSSGISKHKQFIFQSSPAPLSQLRMLTEAAAGLANNHPMDGGVEGLARTLEALDVFGIAHAGAGVNAEQAFAPLVATVEGISIRVFAAGVDNDSMSFASATRPGIAGINLEVLKDGISAKRDASTLTIVMLHWGVEYQPWYSFSEERIARELIDFGADLVVGTGPHVLRGIERYKDGLICYSLGNLVFDDVKDSRASAGALLRMSATIAHGQILARRFSVAPLRTQTARKGPRVPMPSDARAIIHEVAGLSPRGTGLDESRSMAEDGLLWFGLR